MHRPLVLSLLTCSKVSAILSNTQKPRSQKPRRPSRSSAFVIVSSLQERLCVPDNPTEASRQHEQTLTAKNRMVFGKEQQA